MKQYFFIMSAIMLLIACSGNVKPASPVVGKWKSTTDNIVYISEEKTGLKLQFVSPSGKTNTLFGKWIVKNKKFSYKENRTTTECTVETKDLILIHSHYKEFWRRIE